jgi:hypothetical protein
MKMKTNLKAGQMNNNFLNQAAALAALGGGGGGVIQQNLPAGAIQNQ